MAYSRSRYKQQPPPPIVLDNETILAIKQIAMMKAQAEPEPTPESIIAEISAMLRCPPELVAEAILSAPQGDEFAPKKLEGWDVPWIEWVPKYYLRRECAPFADFHIRLWNWFDAIELNKPSCSAVVPWGRGLGKSSTLEGGIIRTCVKGTRRFWLYVCRTLDDANNHVTAIANTLERMGVERSVNKYGVAHGWASNRLIAANGFSVLGVGLDAGTRGIKLDDLRPDGIAFDDVDHLGDSMDMVLKKMGTISRTILPAAGKNVATIFVQNEIGPNTVMARVLDGRFPILADRDPHLAVRIPAIYNFTYEPFVNENGVRTAKITGGTSSWVGKSIDDWQSDIYKETIDAFLVECQHDIRRDGVFFTNYQPEKHVRRANATEGICRSCRGVPKYMERCLACDGTGLYTPCPLPVKRWWKFFGGIDYGRSRKNPFAFVLVALDDQGTCRVIDEIDEPQLPPEEQAQRVITILSSHGIPLGDCPIYCGAEIFPKAPQVATAHTSGTGQPKVIKPDWQMFASGGRHVSDIYKSAGLRVMPAIASNTHDERVNGWAAVNTYLDKSGGFYIYDGRCPNLMRTIAAAPPSQMDTRDIDTTSDDHLLDALRFVLRMPILSPELPAAERFMHAGTQQWVMNTLDQRRKKLSEQQAKQKHRGYSLRGR